MARKSKRGGASAPAKCKTSLRTCLKSGPALSSSVSARCFTAFNRCRAPGKKRGKKRK